MAAIKNATEKRKGSIPYLFFRQQVQFLMISLLHVANEFDDHHPDRKNTFGSFTLKDL